MPRLKEFTTETKFTPDTYAEYLRTPRHIIDGFDTRTEYENYWSGTIAQWLSTSKNHTSKWKATCRKALQMVEYNEDASAAYTNIDQALAYSPIPIAYASIQEQTALLSTNIASPIMVSQEESENQYVAASNAILDCELTENNWEQLANDVFYTGQFYNLAYLKTLIDYNQYGPYGQKGKICIECVHPDDMYPDPKAKKFSWEYMDFIIQEHSMEIGDIRRKYPVQGFRIADDAETAQYTSMQDQKSEDTILSPIPKLAKGPSWSRQRIKVYECWFKDSILKFVPQTKPTREETDELGNVKTIYKPLVTDEDGYVVGDWLPAYPAGRCIVASERILLEDMANRLPHGKAPFIPIKFAPTENPYVAGDATRIMVVVDKINHLLGELHAYAGSEIQRSMIVEMGALANKENYKRIPNKSNKAILVNPGRIGHIMRMPPTEVPQFVWTLLQMYQSLLDMVAGSSAIMRGQISDGAQMSAEAMSALQSQASSRVTMKAKYFMASVKELGRQMLWLARRTYDENVKVQVTLPDGSTTSFDWESDKAVFETGDEQEIARLISQESHFIGIKTGTGQPNAKEARQAAADHLYDRNAIDRISLLDAYEYPNRQEINNRMKTQFRDNIAAEAAGRKLGIATVKAEKGEKHTMGAPEKFGA